MRDSYADTVRNIMRHADPLSEIDAIIASGKSGRSPRVMQLRWRVPDQISLRVVAAIFRAMANEMEIASDPKRRSEREALTDAYAARDKAQTRLMTVSGKTR